MGEIGKPVRHIELEPLPDTIPEPAPLPEPVPVPEREEQPA